MRYYLRDMRSLLLKLEGWRTVGNGADSVFGQTLV